MKKRNELKERRRGKRNEKTVIFQRKEKTNKTKIKQKNGQQDDFEFLNFDFFYFSFCQILKFMSSAFFLFLSFSPKEL